MCQIAAYADDIMVIGRSERTMRETFLCVQQETEKIGLVVNEEKTKYLKVAKDAISDHYLKVENIKFESVKEFRYLGSVINSNNSITEELEEEYLHEEDAVLHFKNPWFQFPPHRF